MSDQTNLEKNESIQAIHNKLIIKESLIFGLFFIPLAILYGYSYGQVNFWILVTSFTVLTLFVFIFLFRRLLKPITVIHAHLNTWLESDITEDLLLSGDQISVQTNDDWAEVERKIFKLGRELRRKTKAHSREKIELEAIMNSVGDAIITVNSDTQVVFYNVAFGFLFGMDQIFKNPLYLLDAVRDSTIMENFNKCIEDKTIVTMEVNLVVSSNQPLQEKKFSVRMAPLFREANKESVDDKNHVENKSVYGVVCVLRDISEQKELEERRREFIANASHELRTPIATLKASSDILRTMDMDRDVRMISDKIDRGIKRLSLLTEELMDLSALEAGEVLDLNYTSLSSITEDVIQSLGAINPSRISIEYQLTHGLLDSFRTQQVITNLVTNAIRYSKADGKIAIKWSEDYNENKGVLLSIKDEGPGLSQEMQDRIFDRFYRVDKVRSRTNGGSGIGLSIVKHIVDLHGGKIWVESKQGEGAEFLVFFPSD